MVVDPKPGLHDGAVPHPLDSECGLDDGEVGITAPNVQLPVIDDQSDEVP